MDMKEIYEKMVDKASKDADFKKELLKDAKGALKKIGIDFPEDTTVEVYQSTANHKQFVLPNKSKELDDANLDNVSGGARYDKPVFLGKSF